MLFYKKSFVAVLFLLLNSSFAFDGDPRFQQVLDTTSDSLVKKKLIVFEKKGIERQVDTANYDLEKIIAYAKTFLGTRHRMAGCSKKGIDCSGLIKVTHAKYGIKLPHSSHEQARYGIIIPHKDQLERGDLVFFYNSYHSHNFITHVGIYLGEGKFIHASHTSGVVISPIEDKYWAKRYLFGTRFKG